MPSFPRALKPQETQETRLKAIWESRTLARVTDSENSVFAGAFRFRARLDAAMAARPASVFGPVDFPPCNRQRFFPSSARHRHGVPLRVLAPQSGFIASRPASIRASRLPGFQRRYWRVWVPSGCLTVTSRTAPPITSSDEKALPSAVFSRRCAS